MSTMELSPNIERRVKEGVDVTLEDECHEYILPFDHDVASSAFRGLSRGLRNLDMFATGETDEKLDSSFVYAYRRFGWIFSTAFDTENIRNYRLPTNGKIHSELHWYRDEGIPPRTLTVEKTETDVRLRYEHGFHATDEETYIEAYESDERAGDELYACGQGIKAIHAPYNPSFFEGWRYRPSRISLSIAQQGDGLRIGIDHTAPKQPQWYRMYKHIAPLGGPYARVTLSMENQTSTVQFARGYD